ncbi:microtubule-associated protein CRIPT-domain-containing protein [Parachaetomium inaequale]|uniref:Cysteine-rich PDZ-binding protein n=1 Tax=Parachaetomium inaequale TaxID=2588326 RepID=A0AAN6SUV4_9PEZI|nr:microtubule-associated protein CRIPT-domain-containing protein [Parachaetomium inaequale]
MVCAKCQKLNKTTLATPSVKKKTEMYYGSPASASSSASASGAKKSATLGQSGISKSKLLSKAAKNPYAQYSSSCGRCKTKVSQGHTLCNQCAYRADACHICGKPNKAKTAVPTVDGQKRTFK